MPSASKSNNQPRSVVYVLDRYEMTLDERGLLAAQQYALQAGLPLAVVAVLDGSETADQYESLLAAECSLKTSGVPLMALIGRRSTALHALSNHVAPRLFMQAKTPGTSMLAAHTPAWPGRVEPVQKIVELIHAHPDMCRF